MGRKGSIESQLDRVIYLVIKEEFVTASFIQRRLGITYPTAQSVLMHLAELGYTEKFIPFKKLKVLKHCLIQ
ncbi:MAG TPA: hypothetical protein PKA38_05425 [Candidatus Levybacteria bacterium]|nr:hypothetical protein [Candidatus Levybacteria bacterium]